MDNQVQFQKNIRTIAFLFIAEIVLYGLLWIPQVWHCTDIVRIGDDGYSTFSINWFSCFTELFFLTLLTCLFIEIAKQSSAQRNRKAASVIAFVSIGVSLIALIFIIVYFGLFTHYTSTHWLILRTHTILNYIATFLLIIAFILTIKKIPRHTLSFFGGIFYVVSQSIRLLFLISNFIFWNFLVFKFGDDFLTKYSIIIPYISFFFFLIVNISLLLFLFGLSKHPLPDSQNPADQEIENAENEQHPNP